MRKSIVTVALTMLPMFISSGDLLLANNLNYSIELKGVTIKAKKIEKRIAKKQERRATKFFGFSILQKVNANISEKLELALNSWTGPEGKITSLRRGYNPSSQHYYGKAADLNWDPEIIDYLVSEEGQKWLNAFQLTFYIEGKPGSKKVRSYDHGIYKPYIFYNPSATGDHIHLQLK